MIPKGLRLRHLSFHGPSKPPASISFGPGLNVVFGASNTGKSFIVETIDFMLGGKGPLRDIPERVGYDRVLLAFETLESQQFTIARSADGGAFALHEGLFWDAVPQTSGQTLGDQHNDKRDDNLSAFLLSKLDLAHRVIRRNKRGATQSLSFRNLARLVVVNEEEIIQQRSPLSDGSYIADTPNSAVFKLLLTGVDDSALLQGPSRSPDHARIAQLDLLDELIEDQRHRVREIAGPPSELEDQEKRLENAMKAQEAQLAASEAEFRAASTRRRELLQRVESGRNRLADIRSLLERFTLLSAHYLSDLERLRGIEEGGTLFSALGEGTCPLCGAAPQHHRSSEACDGNMELVVAAARAEIAKILVRQAELKETIAGLRKEAANFERRLPGMEQVAGSVSRQIESIVAPNLRHLRRTYSELAEKRGEVREAQGAHVTLKELEDRRTVLESEVAIQSANFPDVELSTTVADKFALIVLEILKQWNFPDAERVHFDTKSRDLVINGKSRTSFGKGLRAITQASFTIALLEYCRREGTPHPGFVILDSPLLSYREPEGETDDLRDTDVISHFYSFLAASKENRQVIIIENTDPPTQVQASPFTYKFTGEIGNGRCGLFPVEEDSSW